jgi:hypothetical protein
MAFVLAGMGNPHSVVDASNYHLKDWAVSHDETRPNRPFLLRNKLASRGRLRQQAMQKVFAVQSIMFPNRVRIQMRTPGDTLRYHCLGLPANQSLVEASSFGAFERAHLFKHAAWSSSNCAFHLERRQIIGTCTLCNSPEYEDGNAETYCEGCE